MSQQTPTRCKNVRTLSEGHRKALCQLIEAEDSVRAVARRLHIGWETLSLAMNAGATFRPFVADRIEKAIDEARREVAA